ncbi:MAG TPA: NADH/ubiquinone/plastoquinone (complex i) [Cytophagales bacterium]|nr:NADH/ubiquinone/plastoquinone (complex i) [Cytophagales bacterium]HAA18115.1 NADH/ubiquinone/plastoquinone (complex i) [Cytophagales bacterium]HAP61893.1 NADH/ubiquinone/plastoquinone (complex i) [Cytophagales bacterium]
MKTYGNHRTLLLPKERLPLKESNNTTLSQKINGMNESILSLWVLSSPLLLILISLYSRTQSGASCLGIKQGLRLASGVNFLTATLGGFLVWQFGTVDSLRLGGSLGLEIRLDTLSLLMFSMIAVLSWVIFRFSIGYLEGDNRHGLFLGRMALTVASVQLLVLAGNATLLWLAWVGTSLALHRLLVFYPGRHKAQMAARKKFIMARFGDLFLGGALLLLYVGTGTDQLSGIFAAATSGTLAGGIQEGAALLLVLAAIFKSAQFPTHSWLVEVMETPTPVSALLHAGLLNAGPFLITRFAIVMDGTTVGPAFLIVVSAFTALFASAAFLTQPSVKTALGYSSAAHMGFSLLSAGLGVYAAAMLHMVAHSFYKAHSFLSSGSVIDQVRTQRVAMPKRMKSPVRIAASLFLSFAICWGIAMLLGVSPLENPALLVVGTLVMLGLTQLFAPVMDSRRSGRALAIAMGLSAAVATSFFVLEGTMHRYLGTQVPAHASAPGWMQVLMYTVLVVFSVAILLQVLAPTAKAYPFWHRMGIHLRNGFYANSVLDSWLGTFRMEQPLTVPQPKLATPPSQPTPSTPEEVAV